MTTKKISIVGAGLAGSLLAILLGQRGFRVDLFERNPDPRSGTAPAGRSINLALAERGRNALSEAGLLEKVDEFTIPMRGRLLHDLAGNVVLQPYGKDSSEVNYSTHRSLLNKCLLDAAEATGRIRMYFDHQLESVDFEKNTALFAGTDGRHAHPYEVLIGTDGGGSAVRKAMIDGANLGLREEILDHGYKELTIPPDENGEYRLDPNALHIWPRGGFMLIALPNADKSFTVTLFLANDGDPGFEQLKNWPLQQAFMETEFADIVDDIPDLKDEFETNPVGLLGTIRCDKWHIGGKVLLMGDAAHAIVPFHGQGMNAAFEDCSEFVSMLDQAPKGSGWSNLFADFENRRRANAEAIADMALENYIIMRESVRDPRFLLRKSLEHELERRYPGLFVARYSLVMFHLIPYKDARERGVVQAQMLDELLEEVETLDQVDFDRAGMMINERLTAI